MGVGCEWGWVADGYLIIEGETLPYVMEQIIFNFFIFFILMHIIPYFKFLIDLKCIFYFKLSRKNFAAQSERPP